MVSPMSTAKSLYVAVMRSVLPSSSSRPSAAALSPSISTGTLPTISRTSLRSG